MFSRSFHAIPFEKSKNLFIPSGTARYVGSMFLSDTAMLRNGTKFCDRPPCAGGWMCQQHQVSEMTCNFVRVPGWVPHVRVIQLPGRKNEEEWRAAQGVSLSDRLNFASR